MSSDRPGPLIQLLARGPQDTYLDGTDIRPFETSFKRHTRFSLEHVDRPFPKFFLFGRANPIDIPLSADALGSVFLEIRLPALPGAAPEDTWVPKVGYVLLRRIRVWLNETMLVDQERLWYDIADKLWCPEGRRRGLEEMIGAGGLSLAQPHTLLVPLKLPWSKDNFFPLVSMPGAAFSMEVEAETFANCIAPLSTEAREDGAASPTAVVIKNAVFVTPTMVTVSLLVPAAPAPVPATVVVDIGTQARTVSTAEAQEGTGLLEVSFGLETPWAAGTSATLVGSGVSEARPILAATADHWPPSGELAVTALFEMVFLDSEERHVLRRSRMAWMFDAQMDMETKTYKEVSSMEGTIARVPLKTLKIDLSELNFPVRALAWVVYAENYSGAPFVYAPRAILTSQLLVNGQDLTARRPGQYFQLAATFDRARRCSLDGVHFHSFALDAASLQPSGSLGFDKAKRPALEVALAEDYSTPSVVKVFAVVRRVLTLYKGEARFVTL